MSTVMIVTGTILATLVVFLAGFALFILGYRAGFGSGLDEAKKEVMNLMQGVRSMVDAKSTQTDEPEGSEGQADSEQPEQR